MSNQTLSSTTTMIKIIALIVFCNIMGLHMINGDKCYVCDPTSCKHPTSGDIKDCSETGDGGVSGQIFVNGAFGKTTGDTYGEISKDFANNVGAVALNDSIVSWAQMTEWGCYTTKDQHRGCFIVAKGFCDDGKTLPKVITDVTAKFVAFVKSTGLAFENVMKLAGANSITDAQKQNITKWLADNYMSRFFISNLTSNFQMDYCCTGDSCNFASMVQTSVLALIIAVLSIFILV